MMKEIFPDVECILIDANLFVVLVIGFVGTRLWGGSPVESFDQSDFELLLATVGEFRRALTTPFIIAEVNSLLNTTGFARIQCRTALAEYVPALIEQYDESKALALLAGISQFGFSDMSIVQAARDNNAIVLSADGPLVQYLRGQGIASLHYRDWKNIASNLR